MHEALYDLAFKVVQLYFSTLIMHLLVLHGSFRRFTDFHITSRTKKRWSRGESPPRLRL